MKTVAVGLCLVFFFNKMNGQSENAAGHMIEGGKVVVELIKALKGKKELEKSPGCKSGYADLCSVNESSATILVTLYHRVTNEKREIVIQPFMRECCLHIASGVWTYDLKLSTNAPSIRKGDLLIESCENITMNIKY